MPGLPELIVSVGIATQFIKNILQKLNVNVTGVYAVVLSIAISIGVVVYFTVTTGTPFGFQTMILIVQVAIGSNAGYSLLKVARNQPN